MATLFYLWKGYAVILFVIAFWKECNLEKRSSRARLKSLYFIRPARQREKAFTIVPHPQNQPKIKYVYSSDPFLDSLEFSHYPTNHTKPGHRQQQSHPRQFNLSPQFTFQRQPTTFYHAHHFHPSGKIATLKRALLKPCDNPHNPLVIHRNQVEVPYTSTTTPKPSASDLPDPPPIPPPKHVYSYDYYDYFVEPPPPPPPSWDPGWDPPPPAPAWGPPPPAPAWGPPPPPPPPPGWAAPPPAPAWGPPPPAPAWGPPPPPPPPTPAWGPPPGWEEPEKPKKPSKSKYKPEKAKPPEEPPVYEYEPEPPKVIVKPAKSKSKTKVIKAKPVVLKEEKPKVVKEKVKEIKVKPIKEKVVKEKEWVEKDEDKKEKEKTEKGWFFKDTWNKLLDVFKFKDVYESDKVKAVEVRGVKEEEDSSVKADNMTVTTTTEASLLALALEAQKKGEMSTETVTKKKKVGKNGGKGSLPFSLSFDWPSTYLSFIEDSKEEEEE